jgi:hypothetical protein
MINVIIPNEEYSYSEGNEDTLKKTLIAGGLAGATALGVALASKQRQLTAVEQVCGKKPLVGKGKKQAWQECVNRTLPKQTPPPQPPTNPQQNNNKMLLIVGGSILGLGLITLVIYKLKNK